MRDLDIRLALRRQLEDSHRGEPDTRLIDELGLCQGQTRIDLAVVNGTLNGYEIKSDQDTLVRLPGQAAAYSRIFDYVTIVVSGDHVKSIAARIPKWWGISEAKAGVAGVQIAPLRLPRKNQSIDVLAVAQLLWRDEALALLEQLGLKRGMASKPRRFLWAALAANLDQRDLAHHVRQQLRSRSRWRVDPQPRSGDGLSQPFARSSRYQDRLALGRSA
jgi:hypothetical protein